MSKLRNRLIMSFYLSKHEKALKQAIFKKWGHRPKVHYDTGCPNNHAYFIDKKGTITTLIFSYKKGNKKNGKPSKTTPRSTKTNRKRATP